jgi:hypothetical protein
MLTGEPPSRFTGPPAALACVSELILPLVCDRLRCAPEPSCSRHSCYRQRCWRKRSPAPCPSIILDGAPSMAGPSPINSTIQVQLHAPANGKRTSNRLCKVGLEGIVSTKLDAPYRSGPSKSWIQGQKPESSSGDTSSRWDVLKLECPLSGVKRTSGGPAAMSAFDPKRTCPRA